MKFFEKVYSITKKIPRGKVATYGQIAKMANSKWRMAYGKKVTARMVGWALHKNPHPPVVPCHRVLNVKGHLHGFARGLEVKEKLLKAEGVETVEGRVDLGRYLCKL